MTKEVLRVYDGDLYDFEPRGVYATATYEWILRVDKEEAFANLVLNDLADKAGCVLTEDVNNMLAYDSVYVMEYILYGPESAD